METIIKYEKLNAILRKLPIPRIVIDNAALNKDYPKTLEAVRRAASAVGVSYAKVAVVYEAGTFSISALVPQFVAGRGEDDLKIIDVNDFATIDMSRVSRVSTSGYKDTLIPLELTDEFVEGAYEAAKKLYAEQVKNQIMQKMADAQMKEEGFL